LEIRRKILHHCWFNEELELDSLKGFCVGARHHLA
jgi:hypothetical protein